MKIRIPLAASALALMVAGTALAAISPADLAAPLADYKTFITGKLEELVADTKTFTAAVKSGDIEKAKTLYAPTRMSYEAIEPVADLFSKLDRSIDARADDFEKKEQDPRFTGFHRIEYALFVENTAQDLAPFADKLLADVTELSKLITDLALPPEKVVGGAAELMEELAATKISGEEDRYSHTDLWDFKANSEGSQKIFDLVRPLIEKDDGAFVTKVTENFQALDTTLAKYKTEDGYQSYEKLTDEDRKVLASAVNTLAEDLSTLRGKLGLD